MEDYQKLELIGKGAYGVVWKVRNKKTEKISALKIILIKKPEARTIAKQEASLLKKISSPSCSPYISCYYDSFIEKDRLYIDMEYIYGESLKEFAKGFRINGDSTLSRHLLAMMKDLSLGLNYLHSNMIIHRDIKPDNILIDTNYTPKFIDIGLACIFPDGKCSEKNCCFGGFGSPLFMAPETLLKSESFPESDVWSFGASIYFAMTGKEVFIPEVFTLDSLKSKVENSEPAVLNSNSEKLNIAISQMLIKDHNKRINVNELINLLE